MKTVWKSLPHGKISERTLLLDLQMDEIKSVIDWKLNTMRRDGKEIQKFLHRVKRTIDKGWPDNVNGIPNVQQNEE